MPLIPETLRSSTSGTLRGGVVVGGRYRIRSVLGRGRQAVVYDAYDIVTPRSVALKVGLGGPRELPQVRSRMRDEGRVLRGLGGVGVPRHLGAGIDPEGWPWLVMERVEGPALPQMKPLGARVMALRAAARVAHRAHRLGWVHRDLKPAHLTRTERGEICVIDWGIACRMDPWGDQCGGPSLPWVGGTPGYMSPEQRRGRPGRVAQDVYGLGACLFWMLTGGPPCSTGRAGDAERLLSAPPSLVSLCRSALAHDPALRPATAEVFALRLDAWLQQRAHLSTASA